MPTDLATAKQAYFDAENAMQHAWKARAAAATAYADALAAEQGIAVGVEREWRGRRMSVTRWTIEGSVCGALRLYGRIIRKDGTLGVNEREIW